MTDDAPNTDDDRPDLEPDEDDGVPHARPTAPPLDWNIAVDRDQKSIFELHRRFERGDLVVDPGFQRGDVWPQANKNRLIESVLLRLPLPAIYLAQEADASGDREVVIDGRQRLTALFEYINNDYPLKGLQLLPESEFGRRFRDLDKRYQRRIEDFALSVMVLRRGTDPDVKFYLFERLNRGGISLNRQEIRNGIFRGPGLKLVHDLAAPEADFRKVAGERRSWKRMLADELVLRILAFQVQGLEEYGGSMERFLNQALRKLNLMSFQELDVFRTTFGATMFAVHATFGADAFRRFDSERGEVSTHLNAALMDTLCFGFSRVDTLGQFAMNRSVWLDRGPALKAALSNLWTDKAFHDSVRIGTSDTSTVNYRLLRWLKEVERVASIQP